MWWDRSELVEVYLSPTCVGVAAATMPATRWIETRDLDDSFVRLGEVLAEPALDKCGRVRVWLGSTLTRPLMVSATSGARNPREAKALATMLAGDATGIDEPIRTWLSRWRADRGALAVVMPERVWMELHRVIDHAGRTRIAARGKDAARSLGLVSVRPWWNQVLDAVLEESAGNATRFGWSLTDSDGVVHGVVDNGNPVESGFDRLGVHDGDGASLRRRLEVSWNAEEPARHLDFIRVGDADGAAVLGGWRPAGEGRA